MYPNTPRSVYLKDYRPPEYLIEEVDLCFDLDARSTRVEARLELRRNPAAMRGDGDLQLHGEMLELERIAIDGRDLAPVEYRLESQRLTLHRVPDRFRLETRVRIYPEQNTALEGLYLSGDMLCTQCEAEGFRRITYFLDRPDVMARYRTSLVADKSRYPVLLANGNLVESRDLPDGRHLARWEDPFPKPSYLFALVAGDLRFVEDSYRTASGRKVDLRIYVEPENIDKCAHAMRSLKKAMGWDEKTYGREYDLDVYNIVAVSHFNMGAMENKGLNIFNSKYVLARPDTATDADFQGIEGVIAHEYFHNWTGNRITCRDWFQLSLKEGFTVFRDQEHSAEMGSRGVKRIQDVRALRARQFAEDSGPLAHPVRPESYMEINNFYTATVYEKGAEVVRMLAQLLGPGAFRKATDLYFERHDGQAVTTEDFVRCMEDASGRDLGQFRRWYSQAGTPQLQIAGQYDAAVGIFSLHVRQSLPPTPDQPHKEPQHIPLAVGLLDARGSELPLRLEGEEDAAPAPRTRMLEVRKAEECFRFLDLPQRPLPSLLRGFSAPVKVRYDYSDQDLMFLMAHDSDGFNRWDAGQSLFQRILLRMATEPDAQVPDGFFAACRKALRGANADRALLAEILSLPSESYLGDQMETVDVDGIHRARESLRARIAAELHSDLLAIVKQSGETDVFELTPEAVGRRSLKNLCLGYLMSGEDTEVRRLCQEQFAANRNMTDVSAALRLLVDDGGTAEAEALVEFYDRWKDDQLVLDKWFAVQATCKREDTLQRVRGLMSHPDYSITNPNRVRSLVGAFCTGNQYRFHAVDGAGYTFLIDRVSELDPINPQVAARLLQAIARWRHFEGPRREMMRAALWRILEDENLSKDVYEVASKSLGR
jgi:aminopeptidase N